MPAHPEQVQRVEWVKAYSAEVASATKAGLKADISIGHNWGEL